MKNLLSVVLIALAMVLGAQSLVYAAQCPIKGSNYTYSTYESYGKITIRQAFIIENISNSVVYLYVNDFVFRKSGFNTVKPIPESGGFSKYLENPCYIDSSYDLYPGDVVAVSLDYRTDDTTANGWQLCFNKYGSIVVLASIN